MYVQTLMSRCTWTMHGSNTDITSSKLTNGITRAQQLPYAQCKTAVCMTFTKRPVNLSRSNVFIGSEELELVTQFKYLGITLDVNFTFKKHIQKVANTVRFSRKTLNRSGPLISAVAAKANLHCMILSHIEYCFLCGRLLGSPH